MALPDRLLLCPTFAEVARATAHCLRVAVDMPIGLPAPGQSRECEREARRLLGPRRHSIFSTPGREYLLAREFAEVRGVSLQSFHLLPKIGELDQWITPQRQLRVMEAHPELCFLKLAGRPLEASKKTAQGRAVRRHLLGNPAWSESWPSRLVQSDDILDALALLGWARHGGPPLGTEQRDERGLLMQIYGL